jgi:excinuclease UvrABC nuclease subunit
MPIGGDRYAFTDGNISSSPDQPGVYALYKDGTESYIGKATISIRTRLQAHKRGDDGSCTQRSTAYRRETTSSPTSRERELLEEFQHQHGRLPECNEVMP